MLLRGATLLTMVPGASPRRCDLRIIDRRIAAIGELTAEPGEAQVELNGRTICPGFVQGHVHLCQTLFRGQAEDLPLLDWLQTRIWPLEHGHDQASLRKSAELTLREFACSGVTSFQSIESVRGTRYILEEIAATPMRAIVAASLVDLDEAIYPPGFASSSQEALDETEALQADWDGFEGRIEIAYGPRFLLSCSEDLLRQLGQRRAAGARIHTHASEHPGELAAVEARFGKRYIEALADFDLLGPSTGLAHCVHVDPHEEDLLVQSDTAVLHCPSTNLKLGSGIARVHDFLRRGLRIALGSDGAPANNRLDMLTELRSAALLQKLVAGEAALSAEDALALATREGARALGLGDECGTLEPGKSADLVVFDLEDPLLGEEASPYTKLVYAASRAHITGVMARGEWILPA
ncbi:MAG: N-ethylammeline chlorohydrolase [Planctomycetota bacterium]|nr:MAG: N-ethylammeline chlorohydrolase [Planctomycetota bacterium]